jgi:hypothetical protein
MNDGLNFPGLEVGLVMLGGIDVVLELFGVEVLDVVAV